ncbi:unnamed protein product, partial [Musa acuminata var. zebrina]
LDSWSCTLLENNSFPMICWRCCHQISKLLQKQQVLQSFPFFKVHILRKILLSIPA